jgi:general secretion pathway protein A
MYTTFFGFDEPPFSISPDPRFLYLSDSHKEALAHMIYGVRGRKGFTVITGDVGTGKTTLINKFREGLDQNVRIVSLNNPDLSREDFYYVISRALDIDVGLSKARFLAALEGYLTAAEGRGEQVLLIVDEAQNLPRFLLEEIRLLSNLETAARKLLQIVLVGQQELNDELAQPSLRQLRQRISQKFHIAPLNREETGEYIEHRLEVAGYAGGQQLFSGRAISRLYDFTGGCPRLINVVCDNLLLAAYSREMQRIGASLVKEVCQNLEAAYAPATPALPAPRRGKERDRVAFYGLVALAVLIFLLVFYRTAQPGW